MSVKIQVEPVVKLGSIEDVLKKAFKLKLSINEDEISKNIQSAIKSAINSAGSASQPLKINIDQSYIQQQVNAALKGISSSGANSGTTAASTTTKTSTTTTKTSTTTSTTEAKKTFSKVSAASLTRTQNTVKNLKNDLLALGMTAEQVEAKLEKVTTVLNEVNARRTANGGKVETSMMDGLSTGVEELRQFVREQKASTVSLSDSQTTKMIGDVSGMEAKLKAIKTSAAEAEAVTNSLYASLDKVLNEQSSGAVSRDSLENYKTAMVEAQSFLRSTADAEKAQKIGTVNVDTSQIDKYRNTISNLANELTALGMDANSVTEKMWGASKALGAVEDQQAANNGRVENGVLDSLKQEIVDLQQVTTERKQAAKSATEYSTAMEKLGRATTNVTNVKNDMATGKYSSYTSELNSLLTQWDNVTNSISAKQTETPDYKPTIQELQQMLDLEKQISLVRDKASNKTSNDKRVTQLDTNMQNLLTTIMNFSAVNTKLEGTDTGFGLQKLASDIRNGSLGAADAQQRFASLREEATRLGLTSETLGSRLSRLFKDHMNTAIAMAGIHALQTAFQEIKQSVVEVDTAMTNLKKVSSGTSADYSAFLSNASEQAVKLGSTISGVIEASAEFARLGYNLDDSAILGQEAVKYTNVSEYTDVASASESLISTMKAFGVEADAVGSIVDKFNEVGNNYAISSEGLGEALKRSASALSAAGNDMDQSIALVTAANSVVQDPESVGTALKTMSMRLRSTKTEMEEAGEDTEGMAETVSQLRKELLALTNNQVDIQLSEDSYKSTYEIVKEMSEVWSQMTDMQQAAALELMGGKRQGNVLSSMISNFDVAKEALDTSVNSLGSADTENAKYLDSIEGKMQQFQATLQGFATTLVSSDIVKFFVDLGTGAISAADALTEVTGGIPVLAAGLSGIMSLGGQQGEGIFKLFTLFSNNNRKTKLDFSEAKDIHKQFVTIRDTAADAEAEFAKFRTSTSNNNFADFLIKNKEASMTALESLEAYNAEVKRTSSETKKLNFKNALTSIGAGLANVGATLAITTAISFAVKIFQSFINAHDDAIKKSEELRESYKSTMSELSDKKASVESIAPEYEELAKGISMNGENVSLTADEYTRYAEIANQIASLFPEMVSGFNSQGDAIIKNKGDVEALTAALEEQNRVAAISNLNSTPDILKGIREKNKDYEKEIEGITSQEDKLRAAVENAQKNGQKTVVLDNSDHTWTDDILSGTYAAGVVTTSVENAEAALTSLMRQHATVTANMKNNQTGLNQSILDYLKYVDASYNLVEDENMSSLLQDISLNMTFDEDASWGNITAQISAMTNVVSESKPEVQKAISDAFKLDPSTMTADDFRKKWAEIIQTIHTDPSLREVISDEDWRSMFNIDGIFDEFDTLTETVKQNLIDTFDAIADYDGSLFHNFKLEDLNLDQLKTLNSIMQDTGDQSASLITQISALVSAGVELPEILNACTASLSSQSRELKTVSGDLAEYNEALDGISNDPVANQDTLRGIYEDFEESVKKGQINTEKAREQMQLLSGDIMDLGEARQWLKDNGGFFAEDKDSIGLDAYSSLQTLKEKYQELGKEQKKTVDTLLNANWNTGAMQVAKSDVEELAQAFGVSSTVLQQAFDLMTSYSNYAAPSAADAVNKIQSVNDAVYTLNSLGSKVNGADNAMAALTQHLGKNAITAKQALEDLLGADYDFSNFNVSDLNELTADLNNLRSAIDTVGQKAGDSFLSSIGTGVQDVDGSIKYIVDDLGAAMESLNTNAELNIEVKNEESLRSFLQSIDGYTNSEDQTIHFEITDNTEEANKTASALQTELQALADKYDIDIDYSAVSAANTAVGRLAASIKNLPTSREIVLTTVEQKITRSLNNGYTSTAMLNGANYHGAIGQHAAVGGKPKPGKVLVGELGPELWISADGKHERIVGQNGMEVINLGSGDAIVPADLTDALIRGGATHADGGVYDGINSSGFVSNLTNGGASAAAAYRSSKYAKNGSSSSSDNADDEYKKQAEAEIATLKYKLHMELITQRQYYDELARINEKYYKGKEAYLEEERDLNMELFDLRRELDKDAISDYEHQLFLAEKNGYSIDGQISMYKELQKMTAALGKDARAAGLTENDSYLQELQKQWEQTTTFVQQ